MNVATGPLHVVVLGVSGSGKSAVAERVAAELAVPFEEGDHHHPRRNVEKMAAGVPLTDEDRWPWLHELAQVLARTHASGSSSVLSCSALRRRYRDVVASQVPPDAVLWVLLQADPDTLAHRVAARRGHFMPASLLRSQLDTLEPLEADEPGVVLDAAAPVDQVVSQAVAAARAAGAG